MNVRVHAGLDQFFQCFRLVVPVLACGGSWLIYLWESSTATRVELVTAGLGLLAVGLIWWLLPVECTRVGCTGRMRRTTQRISFWRVSARYQCDNCDAVHQVEIFDPNFEITSGDY